MVAEASDSYTAYGPLGRLFLLFSLSCSCHMHAIIYSNNAWQCRPLLTHAHTCVDVCLSHYEYHTSVFSPSCVNPLVLRRSHDLNVDNVQSKINDVLPTACVERALMVLAAECHVSQTDLIHLSKKLCSCFKGLYNLCYQSA